MTFFRKFWEPFQPAFAAVEALNVALQRALADTAGSYDGADATKQFCTRFLMREVRVGACVCQGVIALCVWVTHARAVCRCATSSWRRTMRSTARWRRSAAARFMRARLCPMCRRSTRTTATTTANQLRRRSPCRRWLALACGVSSPSFPVRCGSVGERVRGWG